MNIITKLLYKLRKNYYKSISCVAIVVFVVMIAVLFISKIKNFFVFYLLMNSYMLLVTIYLFAKIISITLQMKKQKHKICSEKTKTYYSALRKYGVLLLTFMIVLLILFELMIITKRINYEVLRFALIIAIMVISIIKSYFFDFVVVFFDEYFLVGSNKCFYENITELKRFKTVEYIDFDDVIYFEIYNKNRYIGFDKFYESDYNLLSNKLSNVDYVI